MAVFNAPNKLPNHVWRLGRAKGWECTLPETNSHFAPENGWLEYFLVSFWGPGLFSGALAVTLVSGDCFRAFAGCAWCEMALSRLLLMALDLCLGLRNGKGHFLLTQVFRNGGFFAAFQWISDYHSRCLEVRLSCRSCRWSHVSSWFSPWEVIPIWPPWWLNRQNASTLLVLLINKSKLNAHKDGTLRSIKPATINSNQTTSIINHQS